MNAHALYFHSPPVALTLRDHIDARVFNALYARSLVYNACWEDPAVDRQALELTPDETVLVIASAGCNALDYALDGPQRIHAVDANPRQIALLELKIAGIRRLAHADFFALFGRGHHPRFAELYFRHLRWELSAFSRAWWDRHGVWFTDRRNGLYYRGLAGLVARAFRAYLRLRPKLAADVRALFDAQDLSAQRRLYDERIAPALWTPMMNWALGRQLTLSLLGVPHPQRRLVQTQHPQGVAGYIRAAIEYVFRELPAADNYFWRVYIEGAYRPECCPRYLKPEHFEALKAGLVDRITPHVCSVTEFLREHKRPLSRFVLLDHLDWMSTYYPAALVEELDLLLARARPGARVLLRSAHADPAFLHWARVGPARRPLPEVVEFDDARAAQLQRLDRVHTYAGFKIGRISALA